MADQFRCPPNEAFQMLFFNKGWGGGDSLCGFRQIDTRRGDTAWVCVGNVVASYDKPKRLATGAYILNLDYESVYVFYL